MDKESYQRILNNMIQNVLHHSKATQIFVAVFADNKKAGVSVTDNGRGISKVDLPYVFERLYKCDPARSGSGSGLGLSIVQRLTTKLGGKVSVESIEGKGSKFSVTFPRVS
ncbi:MAG: sensor histidine kinase [Clostridiales bacterium]|nr:sensor histidine kinase [Clostridiales bacterium]